MTGRGGTCKQNKGDFASTSKMHKRKQCTQSYKISPEPVVLSAVEITRKCGN